MNPDAKLEVTDDPKFQKSRPERVLPAGIGKLRDEAIMRMQAAGVWEMLSALRLQFRFTLEPADVDRTMRELTLAMAKELARGFMSEVVFANALQGHVVKVSSVQIIVKAVADSRRDALVTAPFFWMIAREKLSLERRSTGRKLDRAARAAAWVGGDSSTGWDVVYRDRRVLAALQKAMERTINPLRGNGAEDDARQAAATLDRFSFDLEDFMSGRSPIDGATYSWAAKALDDLEVRDALGGEAQVGDHATTIEDRAALPDFELWSKHAAQAQQNCEELNSLRRLMDEMLGELPSRQRAVVQMTVIDGLRNVEAAQRLDVNPGTVGRYKNEAAESLAKGLVSRVRDVYSMSSLREKFGYAIDAASIDRVVAWVNNRGRGK